MAETRDEVARRIAEHVSRSPIAKDLAVRVLECRLGYARLACAVAARMVNGHGICHGGYIFTLADMAGAYACLSHGAPTVTQTANITFLSPAQPGEMLTAEAVEMSRTRRSGTYDVRVTAPDGRLVALFRGQWRIGDGSAVPELKS